MSNQTTLFKFCRAEGGIAILRHKSIFITSPLDLNDPFEMRPAWTDAHEKRAREDQERRNTMVAGFPMYAAMDDGSAPLIGRTPRMTEPPLTAVDDHRGIADTHNAKVFEILHKHYRVLSFSTGIIDFEGSRMDSDETTTLLWSHYGDSFQGVCLIFDSAEFDNGLQQGGFPVDYSPERSGLPPSFYDVFMKLTAPQLSYCGEHFAEDPESGLWLSPEDKQEKMKQHLLRFLTQKSPAWSYECEVRMIYELETVQASGHYAQPKDKCKTCQESNVPFERCSHQTYRDAITLSPSAIKGVILGTDTGKSEVAEILKLLAAPEYSHVVVYWSSLHSDRYILQYNQDRDTGSERYSMFIQGLREKQIAEAKSHITYSEGALRYTPAKKTVNYCPPEQNRPS